MTQFGNEDLQNPMTNNPFRITAELHPGSGLSCMTTSFPRQLSDLQTSQPAACTSVWFPNRSEAADRLCQMWTLVRQYGDSRWDLQSSFHRLVDEICLHGYHSNIMLLTLHNSPPNSKNIRLYAGARWASTNTNS